MTEDVARTTHIARQLGEVIPIPRQSIDALFDRYQNVYGQASTGALDEITPDLDTEGLDA
jgi:L-ribulose-5-phosphate 4-epimerase